MQVDRSTGSALFVAYSLPEDFSEQNPNKLKQEAK